MNAAVTLAEQRMEGSRFLINNKFYRICTAIILLLLIVYLGEKVNFIFSPLTSLIHIIIIPLLIALGDKSLTLRQKTNILDPDYRYIKVLAFTALADIYLFHCRLVAAEQAFLHFPERPASLNEIDGFDTRGEALEVTERLVSELAH